MRPTEKASRTEYVAEPGDVCCVFAVTSYPPIRRPDKDGHEYTDGGWVSLQKFHADCRNHHSLRERCRRAWRTFWGCPDTEVYLESDEELAVVLGALGRAANHAFSDTRVVQLSPSSTRRDL